MCKKQLVAILCYLLTTAVFAAPTPITIGIIYNVQGVQTPLDQFSLRGARLAVQQINANGGLLGRQLHLDVQKGNLKILEIQSIANKLSSNKLISVVIGLSGNKLVKAAALPIIQAGKVFISSRATTPTLLTRFPRRFFLTSFTDNLQAAAAAQFVTKQLYRQRAVVLYQQNMTDARSLAHYFISAFSHFNGKVVDQQAVSGTKWINTLLTAINRTHANIIFLATDPTMTSTWIKQLRIHHITTPIISGNSIVAANIIQYGKQIANDIFFTTPGYFDPNFIQPKMLAFVKAYQKEYGQPPPSISAALGYDAVQLAAAGIRKAKSTEADKIAAAIKRINDFSALTGDLNLSGKLPTKTVTVVKLIKAKARIAALIIPQYIPKIDQPLKQPIKKSAINL